ncbi:hypothetical protein C1645_833103, partial [Glomus cerebriforme]
MVQKSAEQENVVILDEIVEKILRKNLNVGRIIEIFNPQQGINTAYIEHWKYNPLEQDRLLNTPKKLIPIFTPCSGCNRHTYFYRDLRPKCVINIPLYNLHRISLQHKNYNPFSHLTISFRNYIITKDPFCSLRVTTYNLYRQRSNNSTPITITDTQLPSPLTLSSPPYNHLVTDITDPILKQSLLGCKTTLLRLQEIKISHHQFRHFTFFTDGSVKHLTSQNCRIGFGWIETEANIHTSHFYGRTTHLPSATKAETMALLTAILTVPPNSTITMSQIQQLYIMAAIETIN